MLVEVGFDNFVKLEIPNGRKLLNLFGKYEELTIFDIGACEGEDSIRYARFFPLSKVHSFEPSPSNFDIVSKNVNRYKLKDRIYTNKFALSNKKGSAAFYLSNGRPSDVKPKGDWDYGNKSSSLLEPGKTLDINPWLKFEKKTTVKTETIDNYCATKKIDSIDLIHMDVQGAELMVLKGAKKMLRNVKAIWLEVEAVELYKEQPLKKDVEKFMKQAGFKKLTDTVDNVAGDQLYIHQTLWDRLSSKKEVKTNLVDRLLIKRLNLTKISPNSVNFDLYIPLNHRWTFSENTYYEQNLAYWYRRIIDKFNEENKKPIVYDIGSNCAYYSLLACEGSQEVHAFEPSRESSKIIKLNLKINEINNVTLHKVALTDKAGKLNFNTYSSSGNDSLISRKIPEGHELKHKKTYQVQANRLDNVIKEKGIPLPDLIKMDIEGAELFALKGAKKTLKDAGYPPLLLEYSKATSEDAGYKREELIKLLASFGYKVYGLSEDNVTTKLIPIRNDGKISKVDNILALNDNDLSESIVREL